MSDDDRRWEKECMKDTVCHFMGIGGGGENAEEDASSVVGGEYWGEMSKNLPCFTGRYD